MVSLAAAGLTWHGCRDDEGLLGAVATTAAGGMVDIDRLVVAPRAFRRGVGTALVAHVLALADGPVTVSTGRAQHSGPRPLVGRGKGSHRMLRLVDEDGVEVARFGVTDHPGDMSAMLLRRLEQRLEPLFGPRWTEKR